MLFRSAPAPRPVLERRLSEEAAAVTLSTISAADALKRLLARTQEIQKQILEIKTLCEGNTKQLDVITKCILEGDSTSSTGDRSEDDNTQATEFIVSDAEEEQEDKGKPKLKRRNAES